MDTQSLSPKARLLLELLQEVLTDLTFAIHETHGEVKVDLKIRTVPQSSKRGDRWL